MCVLEPAYLNLQIITRPLEENIALETFRTLLCIYIGRLKVGAYEL